MDGDCLTSAATCSTWSAASARRAQPRAASRRLERDARRNAVVGVPDRRRGTEPSAQRRGALIAGRRSGDGAGRTSPNQPRRLRQADGDARAPRPRRSSARDRRRRRVRGATTPRSPGIDRRAAPPRRTLRHAGRSAAKKAAADCGKEGEESSRKAARKAAAAARRPQGAARAAARQPADRPAKHQAAQAAAQASAGSPSRSGRRAPRRDRGRGRRRARSPVAGVWPAIVALRRCALASRADC